MLPVKISRPMTYEVAAPAIHDHLVSTLQAPAEPIHHPISGKTLAGRGSGLNPKTPGVTQPGYHPTTQLPLAGNRDNSVIARSVQATYLANLPESTGPTSMMGGNTVAGAPTSTVPATRARVGTVARAKVAGTQPTTFLPVLVSRFVPSSPPVKRITSQQAPAGTAAAGVRPGANTKHSHVLLTAAAIAAVIGAVWYYRG